jgi:hypothetical protein
VEYARYAPSKAIFERLWKDKKIMEAPVKNYLRNDALQWPTLINNPAGGTPDDADNITIDSYFTPPPANIKGLAKLYDNLSSVISFISGLCGLAFLGLLVLQFANTSRFPLFTKQKNQLNNVQFTWKDSTGKGHVKEIFVSINDSVTRFTAGKGSNLQLPYSDSPQAIAITVDNNVAFDSLMPVNKDKYEIVLKDKVKETAGTMLTIITNPICGGEFKTGNYSKMIESLDKKDWPVIRLTTETAENVSSQVCLAEIRVGKGVDLKMVSDLINRFQKAGIYLTLRPGGIDLFPLREEATGSNYLVSFTMLRQKADDAPADLKDVEVTPGTITPRDGEIIVSGNTDNATPSPGNKTNPPGKIPPKLPIPKPQVYIQVSDKSMMAGAETFRKGLISKGYDVNSVEIMDWKYNSEIYYFDKVMEQSAGKIQELYKTFYPALPVKAVLRTANDNKPRDNRIVVWMKKLDGSKDGDVQTGGGIGQRIVDIALKEIGTGENPTGSGKTKYGEWFDAKQNAGGIKAWAGIFVSWVYSQAGKPLDIEGNGKGFYSVANALQYFNSKKIITSDPVPGDIVIVIQKVGYQAGIFVKWRDKAKGYFETVEGNINSGTGQKNVVAAGVRSTQTQKVYFAHLVPGERSKPSTQR